MIALMCTVQEDSTYWRPAQTSDAIFNQMSKEKYLEIPLSTVKKERKLGEGEFGEVFKGEWTTPTKTLTVALKSLKSSAQKRRVETPPRGSHHGIVHSSPHCQTVRSCHTVRTSKYTCVQTPNMALHDEAIHGSPAVCPRA